MKSPHFRYHMIAGAVITALLTACSSGSSDDDTPTPEPTPTPTPDPTPEPQLPQLSEAVGAALKGRCEDLAGFAYPRATISVAETVAAGAVKVSGTDIGEHCRIRGELEQRVSPIDNETYAIGFEMRLPVDWNGRYFYQGNGGTDGSISNAYGTYGSGGALSNALHKGFAVISSDAGHNGSQNPLFGLDPEARINYGYGAAQKLTPMAKAMIASAYGKGPDRSYFGGNSNGGRHAMVAAARLAEEYDGILASAPGFNLPLAAVAQLYSAQQFRKTATDETDLSTGFTEAERRTVANAILRQCDALDGASDGLVQDIEACRSAFDLARDVTTCAADRDGTCLTTEQKQAVGDMYRGPVNSKGEALYATQPYDPGLVARGWANWKYTSSVGNARDPVAVGIIFQVPPDASVATDTNASREFAFNYNFDTDFPKLFATDATYTEDSLSFMTPPNATQLETLRDRGGKMIVVHGASDGVFSVDDTQQWYEGLMQANNGDASKFARFFPVPGMGHGSGGPSTDQFDMLDSLIDWVERGKAPDSVLAQARGAGNPGGVNTELPADWAPDRTRPLCPYPLVARYNGSGSIERAENFSCKE
ncbi:tannase/feruloyl esterase family alpha/beta hydrolase [Pusillimonas sp. CC-YST705]|uniref:Tannase/feruloyl esterase family alpha/beta hydrolase n=1 Tax=Mesopusillimonas faecipullorum TaxID=2755040 RepID=A0ABS8C7Z8_9BURK|nr:tannase/feruloyl esterase family alpha/beta hydrolase [Mesopusillimonas faecipullorum]MCB5362159.1 tannase/feruloyl esterase family alpha/beta hydrolase [Mesopusillimonas faecipullorum]